MHLQSGRQTAKFQLAGGIGGWDQDAEMASHAKCPLLDLAAGAAANRISSGSPPARNRAPAARASQPWCKRSTAAIVHLAGLARRRSFALALPLGAAITLANPIEVPMPSKAAGKASRSLDPIDFQR